MPVKRPSLSAGILLSLLPVCIVSAQPTDYDALFHEHLREAFKSLIPTKESDVDKDGIKWSYEAFKAGYLHGVAFVKEHRHRPFICLTGITEDQMSFLHGYGYGSSDAFDRITKVYQSMIKRLHTDDYDRDVAVGRDLIFHALAIDDVCGLQLLLSRGANVLAENRWNERPLDVAVNLRRREAVRLLLDYKAPIVVKNEKVTPVHAATNTEVLSVLLSHCGDVGDFEKVTSSLALAYLETWAIDAGLLKLVLDEGADPNATDSAGNSPLHRTTSPAGARLLIKHGANVNQRNAKGATPLDVCRDSEMIALLKKHGGKLHLHKNDPLWIVTGLHTEMPGMQLENRSIETVLQFIAVLSDVNVHVEWKLLADVGIKPEQTITFTFKKGETARSALKRLVNHIKPGWLEVRAASPIRVEIRTANIN